jgi:hypothetical protein
VVPTTSEWTESDVEGESLQKTLQRLSRPDEDGFLLYLPVCCKTHYERKRQSGAGSPFLTQTT